MTIDMIVRRPIGRILVDGGFIEGHELEVALREQQQTNELLGQALVRMGLIDKPDLDAALSIQGHLATVEDAVKTAAGIRSMLGSLLLMTGRITGEQLDFALSEQKITGEKLGDILVRQGLLTENQVSSVLTFQERQETPAQSESPLRLGEILVSSGDITKDQLDDALHKQTGSGKKLGEILVEEGYAHLHQVNRGITLQLKLMRAVLVAVVSLAGLSMQGCGGGGAATSPSLAVPAASVSATVSTGQADADRIKTNYLQIVDTDYNFRAQPDFFYSCDNQNFWSIQANIANSVTDINSVTVFRIDIPKSGAKLPELNRSFSIEEGGLHDKFPGTFSVFDGQLTSRKKVEQGTITFSQDSVMSDHVSGSFSLVLTDYDSALYPAPQYRLKGVFSFRMGEFGPSV